MNIKLISLVILVENINYTCFFKLSTNLKNITQINKNNLCPPNQSAMRLVPRLVHHQFKFFKRFTD